MLSNGCNLLETFSVKMMQVNNQIWANLATCNLIYLHRHCTWIVQLYSPGNKEHVLCTLLPGTTKIPLGRDVIISFSVLKTTQLLNAILLLEWCLKMSVNRANRLYCCYCRPIHFMLWLYFYIVHVQCLLIVQLLSLPSVLWHCWLGGRKGIRPVKNWVAGCWHGRLSGSRCRLAYGPADSTATHCHCLLLQ